jgi:hypothetical protein
MIAASVPITHSISLRGRSSVRCIDRGFTIWYSFSELQTAVPEIARALLVLCCATIVHARPDPSDLLLRERNKLLNTVDRLPRYPCTQTVDRTQYEPSGLTFSKDCETMERLRASAS